MYIHIGDKKIISDRKTIGIFNIETLKMSEKNIWILKDCTFDTKLVAIVEDTTIITSKVSPFTVLKRTENENDFIWRKDNVKQDV